MTILKRYVDEENWEETTAEELVDKCEGSGWWKEGTALQELKDRGIVRTPYAMYKKGERNEYKNNGVSDNKPKKW